MARVTVEDCTAIIKNRFELVVLASRRAKDIATGADAQIDRDNEKDAVISLREIAAKKVTKEQLYEEIIQSYQDTSDYKVLTQNSIKHFDPNSTTQVKGMFADDNITVED